MPPHTWVGVLIEEVIHTMNRVVTRTVRVVLPSKRIRYEVEARKVEIDVEITWIT